MTERNTDEDKNIEIRQDLTNSSVSSWANRKIKLQDPLSLLNHYLISAIDHANTLDLMFSALERSSDRETAQTIARELKTARDIARKQDYARILDLIKILVDTLNTDLTLARKYAAIEVSNSLDAARDIAIKINTSRTIFDVESILDQAKSIDISLDQLFEPKRSLNNEYDYILIFNIARLTIAAIILLLENPEFNPHFTSFTLVTKFNDQLTANFLQNIVSPYIASIVDLQVTISKVVKNKSKKEVAVKLIRQNSPISVSLEGASDAIGTIRELVTPWRREHSQALAKLEEQEKIVLIERQRAEVLEKRAFAEKNRSEAKHVRAEVAKVEAETEKLELENEKLRLEIHEARINLALRVLEKLSPELDETQRMVHMIELLKPLDLLTSSPLELLE